MPFSALRCTCCVFLAVLWTGLSAAGSDAVAAKTQTQPWWKQAVIYQIYVRSFQDSNGDGIGDLNGITARLSYLQELGVDAIWLTPCFPSPLVDFGYDVADYTEVAHEYGTLGDFDRLVREANKRHIHVLLDFVFNHTSNQHSWFRDSRSAVNSPKRDWYIWRNGQGSGRPPNEWQSQFGGPAWTLDTATGQYYFHDFWPEQPDLNWRNPQVRRAMYDVVRFWLRRGVAGFRLDAVPSLFEDPDLAHPSAAFDKMPETHELLRGLRAVANEYPGDRVLIGETYTNNAAELAGWYGKGDEIHLPLNFQFDLVNRVSAPEYRKRLDDEQQHLANAWPAHFLSSHDQPRQIDRFGDGVHNQAIAKLMATLLLTSRGTPVVYYGDEIGMTTTVPTRVEDVKDMDGIRNWPAKKGRDGERTPMQWDHTPKSGFTTGTPWLPVPPGAAGVNVATESADPASILNYYRKLIQVRREHGPLSLGDYVPLDLPDNDVLAYMRRDSIGAAVLVVLNMSDKTKSIHVAPGYPGTGRGLKTLLRSYVATSSDNGSGKVLVLPAFGAYVGEVQNSIARPAVGVTPNVRIR